MNKKKKRFTRFTALSIIVLIVTFSICARLVYLQIVQAQVYDAKANTKAHKFIKEDAARGNITDSTGKVLATTQQSYNVTYLETDSTKKVFYSTMAKVFYMLDKNGETQKDEFPIKINGNTYSFDFNTNDQKDIRIDTEKFLEYRGFKDNVMKNLSIDKKWKKLTKAEQKKVNDYLLKISPKYVFEKLRVRYKIPSSYTINVDGKTISKKCTLEDIRRFMVARDAVEMQSYSGYQVVDISSNIKRETAIAFMQRLNDLPGVDVKQEPIRSYPFGKLASNVLGYVGKIATSGPDESEAYTERGYDVNSDLIGMSGLEAAEEDRLKGTAGGRVVEVNKNGRVINEFASKDSYPGQNIKTTINADVEYAAEQALNSSLEWLRKNPKGPHDSYTGNATRGAAVAIDVNTGAVIALASYPNFDPNDFSNPNGLSDEAVKKYFPSVEDQMKDLKLTDEQKEFMFPVDKSTGKRVDEYDYLAKHIYDYALLGLTPPGSTFKPLTAIAGLETGAITPDVQVDDEGVFEDNGKVIATFDADGKLGSLDLIGAIAHSSNAYFMSVGRWLRQKCGEDILAQYAWKFGLGAKPNSGINPSTGIEIKENFGQVFNSYSIKNNFGQQAAWKVMKDLLGKAYIKNTAIDLYTSDSDSKDVVKLKASIKDTIKASVIAGKFDKDKFSQLLNEFMESSPEYKDVTLSTSDMNSILKEVNSVVVSYIGQAAAPGAMYSASIGQGNDNFTILQIANYIATIANGGKRYKVHLVDQITDPTDGSVVYKNNTEVVEDTKVSQATLSTVKEGMKQVNTIGTAAGKFTDFPFATAGKTGTADPYSSNEFEKKIGRTSYALYVGFAPADNPKIAVATILYDGGFGGQSTDVARAIYEAYFNKVEKIPNFPQEFPITAQKEVDTP